MSREYPAAWIAACRQFHNRVLTGLHAHYCGQHQMRPVDESTGEWPCSCFEKRSPRKPDALADVTDDDGEVV